MASSINGSCQSMARCTAHLTRRAQAQALRTRTYATAADVNRQRPRAEEVEELPSGFRLDALSSMAHVELQTHRELRNLARLAAWEMPLLSKLSKPFEPPTLATPLRWRYTTYLGELHPAASKVVVEFSLRDLKDMTEEQKQTMRKLAGARWDSETDIIKMSCESFDSQAQNKRYLGETIAELIKEAKEGEDKFEDVPLDMRVQAARQKKRLKRSPRVQFPEAWQMTPERRAALDAIPGRLPTALIEDVKPAEGTMEQVVREAAEATIAAGGQIYTGDQQSAVSGEEAIERARNIDLQHSEEPIMAHARQPLPKGKMGKKEMGQQPVRR